MPDVADVSINDTNDKLAVPGFRVGAVDAGLRAYFGKTPAPDLTLIVSDRPCNAAGVFTTNHVKAAPVLLDQMHLRTHSAAVHAVLVNTASANACTGEQGWVNAQQSAVRVAEILNCDPESVLVMSTGVIGTQLPMDHMGQGIPRATALLNPHGWQDAARAIMTTDTFPKIASMQVEGVTITGITKGAGMIAPHMATMLGVIVTDAAIPAGLLSDVLRKAADATFNCVVVDGDMSTNDTLLLLANGASGIHFTESTIHSFYSALVWVCTKLAQAIVRDGEGATKFINLRVTGARTPHEARLIANTIGGSPLVKTAFYGGDPNWGRIVAAAGRAGVEIDQSRLALWYEDLQLVGGGTPLNYDEAHAKQIAGQKDINVRLDLGLGDSESYVWTCDLSHDYVSINGHYRT